jgi:hypothetical protein
MHGIGGVAVLLGTTFLMGRLIKRYACAVPRLACSGPEI